MLEETGLDIADIRVDHGCDGIGVLNLRRAQLWQPPGSREAEPFIASLKPRQP
jgi:hypothetical protein